MLVFNESFHEGWEASVNGKVITSRQVVNGFANGWWIDPRYIDEAGGTKEYEIVLKYAPQTKLYIGLGVMTTTLVLVVAYVALSSWRDRRSAP